MINTINRISSVFCFIGLIAVTGNVYKKVQYERVKKQGQETSATATHIRHRGEGSSGDLHVKFVDRDGVEQKAETYIGDFYKELGDELEQNPVIEIKYLAESPSNILALSYSEDPIGNLLEDAGILAGGAFGLFLCAKYRNR